MGADSEQAISHALTNSGSPLVLDLAGLTAIDGTGVQLIVRTAMRGPVLLINVPTFAIDALSSARAMDLPGFIVVPMRNAEGCP